MEEENLDTAIQEDAETAGEQSEGQEEQPKSARELLMEKIDADREDDIKASNLRMLEEAGITQKEESEVVEEVPKKVKVKVDGEELEVPYEEVLVNYQKTSAADKRLREAAAERAQLDSYRAELVAFQEQLKAQQPTAPAEIDEEAIDADIRDALDKVYDGEIDTAAKQLQKVLNAVKTKSSTPAMDEGQVMKAVEYKVAEIQYSNDLKKANEIFLEKYEDLNSDGTLLEIVNMQYQKLLNTGINPVEAATKAGDATREWLQSKTGKANSVDTEGRQKLKEKLTSIPHATAKSQSSFTPEPDDVSSVIAEMKKARNQHY